VKPGFFNRFFRKSIMYKFPLCVIRAVSVMALCAAKVCSAGAAEPAKTPPSAKSSQPAKPSPLDFVSAKDLNTESVISSISAFDRTRPFPVGEKLAYFVNIKDGDKVNSPFRVAFVVSGMGVAPVKAGNLPGTGHHHILIDLPLPADIKAPIPFDKPSEYLHQHYKHFGNGETETILNLPPGKHTLRLLFANHAHVPYYIASKEIKIEVLSRSE
jgi:hypothetical protein